MKVLEKILLGHGSGGELWHDLLEKVILPCFPEVQTLDGAILHFPNKGKVVFTTDSYVVKPIFFPGGDIGSLAVNGCINDLAMMGARPVALSCGFILEEGFPVGELVTICRSMFDSAKEVGMEIITGDTKVVGKGEADGIYINTSGIGYAPYRLDLGPWRIRPGDSIIINGGIGEHGSVILAERYNIRFEPRFFSDSAPLWPAVSVLLREGLNPRVMRDLTRGGLASALWELAKGLSIDLVVDEQAIMIDPRVKKGGELWGIDPFHLACEGRFILITDSSMVEKSLRLIRANGFPEASCIGKAVEGEGKVLLRTEVGSRRIRPLVAELLPRIC